MKYPSSIALSSALPSALLLIASCAGFAMADEPVVDFGGDVLPILSNICFKCHGPDAAVRKADLRLDTFEGATASAITPGDSAASEAIRRVFSDDPTESMPPPDSKLTLTEAQKETLKRWVDQGARYGRHWAYVPPVRPSLPANTGSGRGLNPIDAFVGARLAVEGLEPAPQADMARLLRRVYLDLVGLPPTPAELDAFLADSKPEAYERAVDRLMASPRYGERMVWEWLDAARYADTNGYQGDPTRPMWYWRDWAIQAFNANLPFDEFTIQQLAGDLLPSPSREQLIATGFHRNHMINGEGGRIAEESRVEYVQDRVETTGTVWMGLTLTCCRCHDHKYDPFTQREYYQMAAYFNSLEESGANDAGGLANPVLTFPSAELQQRIDGLKAEEAKAESERTELAQTLQAEQAAWEQSLLGADGKLDEPAWLPLEIVALKSEQGAGLERLDDGSIRASGSNPASDDYVLTYKLPAAPVQPAMIAGFKLEALPDDALPAGGPGRAENGNFVLTELTLTFGEKPVELTLVSADFNQEGWNAKGAFDGDLATGWAVLPEFGKPHALVFAPRLPEQQAPEQEVPEVIACRMSFRFGTQHALGRFRLSMATGDAALLPPLPENIRALVGKPAAERTDAEKKELNDYYLNEHPLYLVATQRRDAARKAREEAEGSAPRTMVMRDRAEPRETFVLSKGAYNAPLDKVEHGVLTGLLPLPGDAPTNRLALARWLIDPAHPLTARVAVNRLWQQFFGTGLVKSAEDFGVQGDKPSHPELLDWLAVELRESGWDTKHLVRLMVTSATYRQSSRTPPGMAERDPENRLLARGPRLRMPSWMLRDQALAISGLLAERLGGPPVKGYQPEGIWEDATFGQIRYEPDHGQALYRRSLYTFWRRIVAPTVFFDVANRQNCVVKTARTNTPLHALVMLNDVTYVEAARALAQRTLLAGTPADDSARLADLFRRATSRLPTERELALLIRRLATLRDAYSQDAESAARLIKIGESPADARLAPGELAAWTGVALLVLNLDETITKE